MGGDLPIRMAHSLDGGRRQVDGKRESGAEQLAGEIRLTGAGEGPEPEPIPAERLSVPGDGRLVLGTPGDVVEDPPGQHRPGGRLKILQPDRRCSRLRACRHAANFAG